MTNQRLATRLKGYFNTFSLRTDQRQHVARMSNDHMLPGTSSSDEHANNASVRCGCVLIMRSLPITCSNHQSSDESPKTGPPMPAATVASRTRADTTVSNTARTSPHCSSEGTTNDSSTNCDQIVYV